MLIVIRYDYDIVLSDDSLVFEDLHDHIIKHTINVITFVNDSQKNSHRARIM